MDNKRELQKDLLDLTIDLVREVGLVGFSLRALAKRAGVSTTQVFRHFDSKDDLLLRALAMCVEEDSDVHDALAASTRDLATAARARTDLMVRYIGVHSRSRHSRFIAEMLVRIMDFPTTAPLVQACLDRRTMFWNAIFAERAAQTAGLGETLALIALMEEFYAYALGDDITYGLLLPDTCRTICEPEAATTVHPPISAILDTQPYSIRLPSNGAANPVATHLLDQAAAMISRTGIESLKQREFARQCGTSASAIAYHFGDMENLRTQAIWHALVIGLPTQFDSDQPSAPPAAGLPEWLKTLDALLDPGTPGGAPGFYVGFSRLTGQTCLMATRDPSLVPLVRYLRSLEGWGTFRVFKQMPELADNVGRAHAAAFGLWVKGEALLRLGQGTQPEDGLERLDQTASFIFGSERCFTRE